MTDDTTTGDVGGKADSYWPAACGGTTVHRSTIPDYRVVAPGIGQPRKLLTTLGKVWKGKVSFDFTPGYCYDQWGKPVDAPSWQVTDGAGRLLPFGTSRTTEYRNVTLPVTITAAGSTHNYTGAFCAPPGDIQNVKFETVGTACIAGPTVRSNYWPQYIHATVGADFEPTTMTYSASSTIYDNWAAPECNELRINEQKLTQTTPTLTSITTRSPLRIATYKTCITSQLDPREAEDADFDVRVGAIVLGVPGTPLP